MSRVSSQIFGMIMTIFLCFYQCKVREETNTLSVINMRTSFNLFGSHKERVAVFSTRN